MDLLVVGDTGYIDLSSNLVYAPPAPDALPTEDHPTVPETVHGRNKRLAERMIETSGCPWILLRAGQVYGGRASSFEWVMLDPIREREFPVPCDGNNRVALVHVDDLVAAAVLALEGDARDRAYNVTAGDTITLGQVFDEVAWGFGLAPPRRTCSRDGARSSTRAAASRPRGDTREQRGVLGEVVCLAPRRARVRNLRRHHGGSARLRPSRAERRHWSHG